ncbi:MAG: hypothetical protein JO308_14625 [Verrucomicrobia bacterium]|nr:hypothetical protein [Verrucomicrobiota bacterium]
MFPLKLIPLTRHAKGVGLAITNKPLLPAQATVVLDTPAPCNDTSFVTVTVDDQAKEPDGSNTVCPAEAALMAACTSAALPFVDIVPFPLEMNAQLEAVCNKSIDAIPKTVLVIIYLLKRL